MTVTPFHANDQGLVESSNLLSYAAAAEHFIVMS